MNGKAPNYIQNKKNIRFVCPQHKETLISAAGWSALAINSSRTEALCLWWTAREFTGSPNRWFIKTTLQWMTHPKSGSLQRFHNTNLKLLWRFPIHSYMPCIILVGDIINKALNDAKFNIYDIH